MGRSFNVKAGTVNDRNKRLIRPINLNLTQDGINSQWKAARDDSGGSSGLGSFSLRSDALGSFRVGMGRMIHLKEVLLSSLHAGHWTGFIRHDGNSLWLGKNNTDIEGAFSIFAPEGGDVHWTIDREFGESFTLIVNFEPLYNDSCPLSAMISGDELTNDREIHRTKRLEIVADSLGHSLLGDFRFSDLEGNQLHSLADLSKGQYPENNGWGLWAFKVQAKLLEAGEDMGLAVRAFGGSDYLTRQWFALMSGFYDSDWNIMLLSCGVNDAAQLLTPSVQLTLADRIDAHIIRRNQRGRKAQPMVFGTPYSVEDLAEGFGSRCCMDVRPPLSGEAGYGSAVFLANSTTVIDLSQTNASYMAQVTVSSGSAQDQSLTGGTQGRVYRIDFEQRTDLIVSGSGVAVVQTLETYLGRQGIIATTVRFEAGETIFVECVKENELYREVHRSKKAGTPHPVGSILDTVSPLQAERVTHFIAENPVGDTRTRLDGIATANVIQSAAITAIEPRNTAGRATTNVTVNSDAGAGSVIISFSGNGGVPSRDDIEQSDVFCRIKDIATDPAVVPDPVAVRTWDQANRPHKILTYNESVENEMTIIEIDFDARAGLGANFSEEARQDGTGVLEVCNVRDLVIEIEGQQGATANNCHYLEHDHEWTDPATGYKVVTVLRDKASFDLIEGQAIVFGFFQEGTTIYMNEITSGKITNTANLTGAADFATFFSNAHEGSGKTRVNIVREIVSAVAGNQSGEYHGGVANNVYLANLHDSSDLAKTNQTAGGLVSFQTSDSLEGARFHVGLAVYNPEYKRTADNGGSSEINAGERLHQSPYGHTKIAERFWAVVQNIPKIP